MMLADSADLQRILVVDDDPNVILILRHTLEDEGFAVISAYSGEEALAYVERRAIPHLAIVDYKMPAGMNGFEFARRVREFCGLPIVMLTGVDESDKIIESLEDFADDYITKPFNPTELVARVQRVLRRMNSFDYTREDRAQVEDRLKVDFPNRQVTMAGQNISLTPTESKILYILMSNAGRTVSTEFLLGRIWPNGDAQEDRLHVHIHRLRRKIEPDPDEPRYVVSARGSGYYFPFTVENL